MSTALRVRQSVDDLPTRFADPDCEAERRALIALGESILAKVPKAWPRFQKWLQAIHGISDQSCRTFSPEAATATMSAVLRRLWMQVAHEASDPHTRSPERDVTTKTPSGAEIEYGYERDLQPKHLERRCFAYAPAPNGWSSDHVIYASAQGGMNAILHWAIRNGFWNQHDAAEALVAGGYFETHDLFDLFARDGLKWRNAKTLDASNLTRTPHSLMLIEPVFFDEGINVFDMKAFHEHWASIDSAEPTLIVLDTTLSGPLFPIDEFLAPLAGPRAPTVIQIRSGLKLDQAGLELADCGIISIFSDAASEFPARDIGRDLRKIRTITGAGLTFDEISALEAPWFLDPHYFRRYSNAVFSNNAMLADALKPRRGLLFERILHPRYAQSDAPWAQAPFLTLHLHDGIAEHYRFLEKVIAFEAQRRGLLFETGGSFGFRGHRYEAVMPDRASPFLRVAMGARHGFSAMGAISLMRDLAAFESIGQLGVRYKGLV